MNEEKLSIRFEKSPFVPDDYFEYSRRQKEIALVKELWERLKADEWYTIKIHRTTPYQFYVSNPSDFPEPVPDFYETSVLIGKINPVYYEFQPQNKLGFMERLKVLFTGDVPMKMERVK